jgi:K+-transporting ATPase c subunit
LEYFTIRSSFSCARCFVSSSPFERWSATEADGNFTIGGSEDVCLFHVSDALTTVTGSYNIGESFDRLYYQHSGLQSTTQSYTGSGTISDMSEYLTVFYWHSEADTAAKSITVHLSSSLLSLPRRRCEGSGTGPDPIILYDGNSDASGKPPSAGTWLPVAADCLAGAIVLVTAAVLSRRCMALRQVDPRKGVKGPLDLEDQSGSGRDYEHQAALRFSRDRERF